MTATRQQRTFYRTFSQHGTGSAMVELEPKDVALLVHISYLDIFEKAAEWFDERFFNIAQRDFYKIERKDVDALPELTVDGAIRYLQLSGVTDTENIIYLYMKNLSELWRRRFKFYNILKTQSFPTTEQIGPRCLLEYGNCDDKLLFSWMTWRKLIYDVDNRSAQETGYLFEPILASCLGGEPMSHRNSPVNRIDAQGNRTNEGRQVDCYIEEAKEVYELKLRVTIAASGQGRFGEEMSFPYEARKAGLTPILIVFDPTPSALLEKLKLKYLEEGGRCAIGEEAWKMLITRAGKEMGKYIEKYIKPPISKMEEMNIVKPQNIHLSTSKESIIISDEAHERYIIPRSVIIE